MPVISDSPAATPATSRNAWDPETDSLVDARSFQSRPLQVTWEMTRACEWKAAPKRALARSHRERPQFSSAEAFHLIEEVAAMHVPLLALTGGDPLLRPDLFPVIEFAAGRSLRTSLMMLPASPLDSAVIHDLKACGLMRGAFWLNGSTPAWNDSYWGIPGLHRKTLDTIGACHEAQLPVQINT